jgi:5-formyltetrahydrofolate cyclo-ligase
MQKTKGEIRKEILKNLNSQADKEVSRKSEIIKKKLFSLPEFEKAKFVMFYASKPKEVATKSMIDKALRAGKRVALPRCTSKGTVVAKEIRNRHTDLEKGTYGIREPRKHRRNVEPDKIDIVIVPGVAFDKKNRRIGRGKGYYDRFLESLPRDAVKIGLAFDFQIVKNLPVDSHDIPVSKVITN